MSKRRLTPQEIGQLRAQRAEGIEEGVLASSWGISRATVSRHTQGVTRVVRPRAMRPIPVVESPRPTPRESREALRRRDDEIRTSSESSSVLADRFGLSAAHVARIRATGPRPQTVRERFAAVAGGAWRADCMTDEEWRDWVAMNPTNLGDRGIADRPCTDCPLGFAAEMRAAGTCNGSPGWQPPAEEEEEPEVTDGPRIIPNAQEVTVGLEAPCARCVHEPVCAIRHALDGMETLPVQLPRLDRALTVVLAAKVDCSHFLAAPKPKRARSAAQIEASTRAIALAREAKVARRENRDEAASA